MARGLGLLVLERDGALAVVRLDAIVPEAGVVPALDDHAPRRLGEHLEHVLHEPAPVPQHRARFGGTDFILSGEQI